MSGDYAWLEEFEADVTSPNGHAADAAVSYQQAGLALLSQHAALLAASAIAPEVAKERDYRSVTEKTVLKRHGFSPSQQRVPALLIPIRNVAGDVALHQLRPDEPRVVDENGKTLKYENPAGSQLALDVPAGIRGRLQDASVDLFVTEGARKVDAAVSAGLCCIGVLGVWGWKPETALADFDRIALTGRNVHLAFDSDVVTKPEVRLALSHLAGFLAGKGATVNIVTLLAGDEGEKVGLDDYLAAGHDADELLQLTQPLDQWLAAQPSEPPKRGTFEERFSSRRVDLFEIHEQGVPPIDYLPAAGGMLVRAKRHLMPAPRKTGKTMVGLIQACDTVLAGGRVAILDRENGANLYAARLGEIMASRGLDEEQRATLRAGLAYYEHPKIRKFDDVDLVAELAGFDLVIFDSQRRFLTDLGLDEDKSDDFAKFAAATIDLLFENDVATLILDNTGHTDEKRPRGSSAKADLTEIMFTLETVEPYSTSRVGKLRLRLEPGASRFGHEGTWELTIGAGVFGSWQRVSEDDIVADERQTHAAEKHAIRQTARAAGIAIVERDYGFHIGETDYKGIAKTAFERAFRLAEHGSRDLARDTFDRLVQEADQAAERSRNPPLFDDPAATQTATDFGLAAHHGDRTGGTYLKANSHAGRGLADTQTATYRDPTEPATPEGSVAGSRRGYRNSRAPATLPASPHPTHGETPEEKARIRQALDAADARRAATR